MNCEAARPLIPSFLDGELSAVQSSQLRPHLLQCTDCRSVAQSQQSLQAWFVPTAEVSVPVGFAAHVARRAMAGDVGTGSLAGEPSGSKTRSHEGTSLDSESLTQFVLQVLAVAAMVLMLVSVAMRRMDRPGAEELKAHGGQALDSSLFELDQLNRMESEVPSLKPSQLESGGSSSR